MLASWATDVIDKIDLVELRERVVGADISSAFPDRATNEQFIASLRASVEENISLLRNVLNGSVHLDDLCLYQPLQFAALQAQMQIPQSSMQHSYRVGFYAMWEACADALLARLPEEVEDEVALQVVELTRIVFAYQDHVAARVADRLSSEEQALNMSRVYVRHRLVQSLLADPDIVPSPADLSTIGYPLDLHHVAVLLPQMAELAASRLAAAITVAGGARYTLVLPRQLDTTVVWCGRATRWTQEALAALRDCVLQVGAVATIGDPGNGLDGFRESLAQAQETEAIRQSWRSGSVPRTLAYADVGLEILLLRDRNLAARFVTAELGKLAADTPEAPRLRETLEASYRLGSHVSTAAELHVHEHTVRNRLRRVEEILGHPLVERSTEVQVALRLLRLL